METLDTLKKLKIILNPPEENLKMKTLLMKNLFGMFEIRVKFLKKFRKKLVNLKDCAQRF